MIMSVDISNIHLADDCVVIAIFLKKYLGKVSYRYKKSKFQDI